MAKITSPIVLSVGDDNDHDAEAEAQAREVTSSDDGQGAAATCPPDEDAPLVDDQDAAPTSPLDDGAPEALQIAHDRTPLANIKETADLLRPIDDEHVRILVVDISERGLLAPILVNWDNVVIDGHHRLRALLRIHTENYAVFTALFPNGLVPVRRVDKDGYVDPERILDTSAAANVLHLPLSEEDILRWYDLLVAAGHPAGRGRPSKAGKRPVGAILKERFGISDTTYARLLAKRRVNNSPGGGITAAKKPRPRPIPEEITTTTTNGPAVPNLVVPVQSDATVSAPKSIQQGVVTYTVPDDDGDPKVGAVEENNQATVSFPKPIDQAKLDGIMSEIRMLSDLEVAALARTFDAYLASIDQSKRRAIG